MSRNDLITKLHNNKRFTDVTFILDGEEIPAHKAILAESCDYFQTMLFGATNEAKASRITLNETPSKQFKEVVRFCYLKKVQIVGWDVVEVCKLLSLAHEYNYDSLLVEVAERTLFSPVSLPVYHDLAMKLNLRPLLAVMKTYVYGNRKEVVMSDEFIGYSAKLVCFIFENLQLINRIVIRTILKWKESHTDHEVQQVFQQIRWERVASDTLAELMRIMIPQTNLLKVPQLEEDPWKDRWNEEEDWNDEYPWGPPD